MKAMKANIGAALSADAAAGSAGGLRELEAAVSSHCEKLLEDSETPVKDKMLDFCDSVTDWLVSEGVNPLTTDSPLKVTTHSTFGKLKATIMALCTCTGKACDQDGGDGDAKSISTNRHQCLLHADEIQLSDVLYEITKTVHSVFDDRFMSFANLFLSQTVSGPGLPVLPCCLQVQSQLCFGLLRILFFIRRAFHSCGILVTQQFLIPEGNLSCLVVLLDKQFHGTRLLITS